MELNLNQDGSVTPGMEIVNEIRKQWPFPEDILSEMQAQDPDSYRVASEYGNQILERGGPDAGRAAVEGMGIVWAIAQLRKRKVVLAGMN